MNTLEEIRNICNLKINKKKKENLFASIKGGILSLCSEK